MQASTSALATETNFGQKIKLKPLSSRQEQRLVDYVDEELIRISGEFKKRYANNAVYSQTFFQNLLSLCSEKPF
jgi:hypothetical protein